MSRPDSIVGYVYRADIFCSDCIQLSFSDKVSNEFSTEAILDLEADNIGINREDENSFDSDTFPKIIFRNQVDNNSELCSLCGEFL